MKRYFFPVILCLLYFPAFAQPNAIRYEVSFPNAVHHEANISLTVPQVPAGPLKVRMSRSSPGRYATHEFGKNIYDVHAFDQAGKPLQVSQLAGDVYQVSGHKGTVKINYTVFGNWVDGTYLGIDETHAHMNMPAAYMWVKGLEDRPVEIIFNDLDKYGWKVATQLKPGTRSNIFTAPDLQYFMDSPVELSGYRQASWKDVNPDGLTQEIRFYTHTEDDQAVIDNYAGMIKRTVLEAKAVFGELPRFDYGTYSFLNDVHPENAGDGMEHRNSTVIVDRIQRIAGAEKELLGTVSHEFFHCWNVERIRPKSLEPFNFEHSNISDELWFAEGFTQYYGELLLKRAGFRTLDEYCETLADQLNYVLNSPAAAGEPPTKMSRYAVFADAGVSIDQNNNINIFNSYYLYGAVTALALDLRLRTEFSLTLDDYMRAVWKTHGKTGIPYTISDLQKILAGITTKSFADDFFRKYIHGTEKNNYGKLLASAGLVLRKANPGKASLGLLRLVSANGGPRIAVNTVKGTAAYKAGLDNGDFLLKINNDTLNIAEDLPAILAKYSPGETVNLTFKHRGSIKTTKTVLQEDQTLEVITIERTGAGITSAAQSFRDNWLSSRQ